MEFIKYKIKGTQQEITAIQLTPENIDDLLSFMITSKRECRRLFPKDDSHAVIELIDSTNRPIIITSHLFYGDFIQTNRLNSNSIHVMMEHVFNDIYELSN